MLVFLTGGGDSLFYLLFFPLVAVNAYYFGPWVALGGRAHGGRAHGGGGLAGAAVDRLDRRHAPGRAVRPAGGASSGIVADRERGARGEVERLNAELDRAR